METAPQLAVHNRAIDNNKNVSEGKISGESIFIWVYFN